jgi:hypothetical protein
MTSTVPSPQAAPERLAEKFGEFSAGLAENGGGDWLSALLITLFTVLIETLRSIRLPAQADAAPVGSAPPTTPRQGSEKPTQAKAPRTTPARPRRQRNRTPRMGRTAPAPAQRPPVAPGHPGHPGGPKRHPARGAASWARATAPPKRCCKNRASAPAADVRPYRYEYSTKAKPGRRGMLGRWAGDGKAASFRVEFLRDHLLKAAAVTMPAATWQRCLPGWREACRVLLRCRAKH